jgi:alpha-glucosidase
MPWSTGPGGGFTTGQPWLPMTERLDRYSVAAQEGDPRSMLALHRRLLALRRDERALHAGAWAALDAPAGVVAYERTAAGATSFRVLLNLRAEAAQVAVPGEWSVAVDTGLRRDGERVTGATILGPDEGLLLRAQLTHAR